MGDAGHVTTIQPRSKVSVDAMPAAVGLTVALHPDLTRVGEVGFLFDLGVRGQVDVGRLAPVFRAPGGPRTAPLDTPLVSRGGLRIVGGARSVTIHQGECSNQVRVDRQPLVGALELPVSRLERGVAIELGRSVVLWLHTLRQGPALPPELGLVGHSQALRQLIAEAQRVAPTDTPVLLLGESGTGKELVARAIHQLSARASGPYVAMSLGAVPESVAEAELFGHCRGAFTGADVAREGYFGSADGGTLFLDEVGEAPEALQPKLLRALENREIQVVGGQTRTVDVRLVSATDADLEAAVAAGRFRRPLLERLRGYSLRVPPLRDRPDDIPRLFVHFLGAGLAANGARPLPPPPADREPGPVAAGLMVELLYASLPGNVRGLRNAVQQLLIQQGGEPRLRGPFPEPALLGPPVDATVASPEASAGHDPQRQRPSEYTDDQVLAALRAHDFHKQRTCDALGVGRTWLHTRLQNLPGLQNASDLAAAQIEQAQAQLGRDVNRLAAHFGVSVRALQLRMAKLGLG